MLAVRPQEIYHKELNVNMNALGNVLWPAILLVSQRLPASTSESSSHCKPSCIEHILAQQPSRNAQLTRQMTQL
jgi:hypothetical protein